MGITLHQSLIACDEGCSDAAANHGVFRMTAFCHQGYFDEGLAHIDPEVHAALQSEEERQNQGVELIASENIVSRAISGIFPPTRRRVFS